MKPPKVLVGVVTYEGKDYIWDRFYKHLCQLSYPNYEILVVDNTKGLKYYNKLVKRTKNNPKITIKHVKRGPTSRHTHADSLNYLRDYFLAGDYDYWLSVESDLLAPKDIIQRLMRHAVDVVGCMYLIGHATSKSQPPRPCLFSERKKEGTLNEVETYNLGEQGYEYFGKGLVQLHGCGLGMTLVRRSVMEKDYSKFEYHLGEPVKHSDVLWYMRLRNAMHPVHCDCNIYIPHYMSDWSKVEDI